MAIIPAVIECDVCRVKKQKANHWYRIAVVGNRFQSSSLDAGPKPWKDEKHVCGPGHAQTLFDRFLTTGTLEMEKHGEETPSV